MLKYFIKRILSVIPVMIGVIILVFVMRVVMPGDPITELLPATASQEQIDALRNKLGLDQPVIVQFGKYVWGIVSRGDLGTSYKTKLPVMDELMRRFPRTISIGLLSILVSQIFGQPLGIISAYKQYTWVDDLIIFFTIAGASIPSFWLALMLIRMFSVKLGWLPAIYTAGSIKSWILPVFVNSLGSMAATARGTRTCMLENIRQDFVKTARAKGQNEFIVIVKHAYGSALVPVVGGLGNAVAMMLGGSLIVETVFGVPGIGKYIADAVTARDFPVIQGGIVVLALAYSIINILVDFFYTVVDPRLKTTLAK